MDCKKCGGTGCYQYDDMHSKVCEYCCKHDKGWWELSHHHMGYEKGKDNRCCLNGCGMLYRDLPEEIRNNQKDES